MLTLSDKNDTIKKEVIFLKVKAYIGILLSHLSVLIVLFTPIIRLSEIKIDSAGEKVTDIFYVNLVDFLKSQGHTLTTVIMIVLTLGHVFGLGNAIFGLVKKEQSHFSVNATFVCSFASALMGALLLYSNSYALFFICAASFLIISFCSIKLIKAEA